MRRLLLLAVWLAAVFTASAQTRFTQYYNSIADLKAAAPNPLSTVSVVKYATNLGDLDTGGVYYYSSSSVAADDGVTVIAPNNGVGRWLRANAPKAGGGGAGGTPAWINVKDPPYNAKGDGVTDDTVAIQTAINAAPTGQGGVTIYLPRGIYIISGPLHLASATQRLIIRGEGLIGSNGTTIKNTTNPNVNFFDVSTPFVSDTISFYGLAFWGAGKASGTGNAIVLGSTGTTMYDSQIQNCWFVNIPNCCIYGQRVMDYMISDCGIEGSNIGIWIDNTSVDPSIYVNYIGINNIFNNTFYGLNTGVLVNYAYATKIVGNTFNICGKDTATNGAVTIYRGNTNETRNVLIGANVFDRSSGHDIYLEGGGSVGAHTGVNGVHVSGNISDFATRSFVFATNADEISIVGNKVNDCSAFTNIYAAIDIEGTSIRPFISGNAVTTQKFGNPGLTYGLYLGPNVTSYNLGQNMLVGNLAPIRIDCAANVPANAFQSSALALQLNNGARMEINPPYNFGLQGTNGSVLGAIGNIVSNNVGKRLTFGYDFSNDEGWLSAGDTGVAQKALNAVNFSLVKFPRTWINGLFDVNGAIRTTNSASFTSGKGMEFTFTPSTTNAAIISFDRDNGSYERISLSGRHITLQPQSTVANVGIGVPIGTDPTERLQITSGNIALDNNRFLKLKDTVGTAENVVGIDGANNVQLNSPTAGGGAIVNVRKGDQTYKVEFATNTIPFTLSSNLVAITAPATMSQGVIVTGGTTNQGDGTIPGGIRLGESNGVNNILIRGRDQLNATITNTWPGTNVSGILQNDGAGKLEWVAASGSGTVTSVAVTSGSQFSVATPTTTPLISLTNATGTSNSPIVLQTNATVSGLTLQGNTTNSGLTASQAILTDANKQLVSQAYTGAGNVMRTRTGIQRSIWIDAGAMVSSSTNGAKTGTYTPSGADNMTKDVYDFDDTTSVSTQFYISMPDEWDLGTVKARFFWTSASGTGGVTWGIAGGAASDNDTLGATLGTEVTVDDTLLATDKLHVTAATSAVTIGGNPALNDGVLFKVARKPANANDTKVGDARLFGVKLYYNESTTEPSAQ